MMLQLDEVARAEPVQVGVSVPASVFRERMPPVLASARVADALAAGAPKGWLFINAERSRKLNIHRYFTLATSFD
jgi:hypothetical protein